jgi:hypothetical protein
MHQENQVQKWTRRSSRTVLSMLAAVLSPGLIAAALFCIAAAPAGSSPPPVFPEEGSGWTLGYSELAREDFSTPGRVLAPASQLGEAGSLVTEAPIDGTASVRGSSDGRKSYQHYFNTQPEELPLKAGTTYRLTFSYRIIEEGDRGFEAIFYSPIGGGQNTWVPGITLRGPAGSSGVAQLEARLFDFPDYRVWLNVIGKGTILVDDIRLFEGDRIVFEENFELMGTGPGPGFRHTGGRGDETDGFLIGDGAGLVTDPDVIVLPKLTTCRISFDYRVLAPSIDDETLNLRLIPYPGASKQVDLRPLLKNAAAEGRFSTGFGTGSAGPYALSIQTGSQSRVLIDNLLIEKATPRQFTEAPEAYAWLENAPFPRLGNYFMISATEQVIWGGYEGRKWQASVEDVERRLALFDVIMGFGQIPFLFDPDLPSRIRTMNPNAVFLPYAIGQETSAYMHSMRLQSADPDGNSDFRYDAGLADEWLVKGINGDPVNDLGYPGIMKLNISPWTPRVGGKTFLEYQLGQYRQDYLGSGIWDGLFIDNLFAKMNPHIPTAWTPETLDYDINRNGKADETPAMLNRISFDAERRLLEELIAGTGNRELIAGNNGTLPETRLAPYVNGYLFENFGQAWNGFGNPQSRDSEFGWRQALDMYLVADANCRSPRINVIEAWGLSDIYDMPEHGRSEITPSDIRQNRFTLATALLGNAFYDFDLTDGRSAISWFDEFAVDADGVARESASGKGYLGRALGPARELASPARKLWAQNFEGFGAGGSGTGDGSRLTKKAEEVLAGKRSIVIEGKSRNSTAWTAFETVPESFILRKGKTYVVEFSWKVLEDLDYGFWCSIDSATDHSETQLDARFKDESGRARYPFTPMEDGDYRLRFSSLSAGKVAIDDLVITEGGAGPWRRDFENGIVLVNPCRAPARFDLKTISGDLGRTVIRRINGTQAPEVNSGAPVTGELVLQPFDAIILLADHRAAR